ncbi:aspartic peptidase domain-containing protein [Halenospora varia]|nr:aspartic peptidase domain-containing protein [Halenospora varia]
MFSQLTISLILSSHFASALPSEVTRHNNPSCSSLTPGLAPLIATEYGMTVEIQATIGNQNFTLDIDTGSSDMWLLGPNSTCIGASDCNYGPTTFNTNTSSTFRHIPNETFGVFYGAGFATGILGYEEVGVAGITIPNQKIGVVSELSIPGDGRKNGILGLAYLLLTSAHPGDKYPNDLENLSYLQNRLPYNPLPFSMAAEHKSLSWFALGINRTPMNESVSLNAGYIGFGTLPPVSHSKNWAKAPVVIVPDLPPSFTNNQTNKRTFWAIEVQSTTIGTRSGSNLTTTPTTSTTLTNSTPFNAVVDNGNPFSFIPGALSEHYHSLWSPPAVKGFFSEDLTKWQVECDATPPVLGFEIGGITFYHDARDLIFPMNGTCVSSLFSSDDLSLAGVSVSFLGLQFLKNVLAVFDFGGNEMRIAARV